VPATDSQVAAGNKIVAIQREADAVVFSFSQTMLQTVQPLAPLLLSPEV
jgi:hypothetical protein